MAAALQLEEADRRESSLGDDGKHWVVISPALAAVVVDPASRTLHAALRTDCVRHKAPAALSGPDPAEVRIQPENRTDAPRLKPPVGPVLSNRLQSCGCE